MIVPTVEIMPSYHRHNITHALFDFDGTLSLIRDGWTEIMLDVFEESVAKAMKNADRGKIAHDVQFFESKGFERCDPISVREHCLPIIENLTGRQTIVQMNELARLITNLRGTPKDPEEYKAEFLSRLEAHIAGRVAGLGSGRLSPDGFLVKGSARLLWELRREVVAFYVFSGTDEQFVTRDLHLLNIDRAFDFVFGATPFLIESSKKAVIQKVLNESGITGDNLVVFGDGMVEILEAKAVGALAVGVASREGHNGERDEAKRNRLVEAGADLIITDYQKFDLWMPLVLGT